MVNGQSYCVSTGTPNKKEAVKIMEKKLAMIKGQASMDVHFEQLFEMMENLTSEEQDRKRLEYANKLKLILI